MMHSVRCRSLSKAFAKEAESEGWTYLWKYAERNDGSTWLRYFNTVVVALVDVDTIISKEQFLPASSHVQPYLGI